MNETFDVLFVARSSVDAFSHRADRSGEERPRAMECQDCEEFLASGIRAFRWLQRAEDLAWQADADGIWKMTPALVAFFDGLYESWLRPCVRANAWIDQLRREGFSLDHVSAFQDAQEEAKATLESRRHKRRSNAAIREKLSRDPW